MIRTGLVLLVVLSLGCATQGQGSSGGASSGGKSSASAAPSSSGGSSGHKMLTEEDYKRIGVAEMGRR